MVKKVEKPYREKISLRFSTGCGKPVENWRCSDCVPEAGIPL
jgi:hypothetical protein